MKLRALKWGAAVAGLLHSGAGITKGGEHDQRDPVQQVEPIVAKAPQRVNTLVEEHYAEITSAPQIKQLLSALRRDELNRKADVVRLTEIEAPAYGEHAKATAVMIEIQKLGIPAFKDRLGSVIALRPGSGKGPTLLVSAHLDTVFPAGTNVRVSERNGKLYGPGVGDDTLGVATIISWIHLLNENHIRTIGNILFVTNVGEEGLNNSRGIKSVIADHPEVDGMVGIEPAADNEIVVSSVGSHRYEISFRGPGGHSFDAFGKTPSAIHAMGRAIAKIADINPPIDPKTTYTIATVNGGTTINTIAPHARMTIDERSVDGSSLDQLDETIRTLIASAVADENRRWKTNLITFDTKTIGGTPSGKTSLTSPLVETSIFAKRAAGFLPVLISSSTDASYVMSVNIPAVVLGAGGISQDAHSLNESLNLSGAARGSSASLLTILSLVGIDDIAKPLLSPRLLTTIPHKR